MADGCDDCLRGQLGWLPESEYPLDPAQQEPERIYCIDGVPAVSPHAAMLGPFVSRLVIPPPGSLAASGPLDGSFTPIEFVNDTARGVNVFIIASGSILMENASATYVWTFRYGANVAVSSPAVATEAVLEAKTNITGPNSIQIGFPLDLFVDAGASVSIAPFMSYSVIGSGSPGTSVFHGANLSLMAFGGPA